MTDFEQVSELLKNIYSYMGGILKAFMTEEIV